jgi:hypothetical protein
MRFIGGALGAFFVALLSTSAHSDSFVQSLPSVEPVIPEESCMYVAEWNGISWVDKSLCSNYAAAIGAVPLNGDAGAPSAIDLTNASNIPPSAISGLGAGVSDFLQSPVSGIPYTWLQPGAATANLGFTPVPNSRIILPGVGLSGGGDLTSDRALSVDSTIVTLANGGTFVPPTDCTGRPQGALYWNGSALALCSLPVVDAVTADDGSTGLTADDGATALTAL